MKRLLLTIAVAGVMMIPFAANAQSFTGQLEKTGEAVYGTAAGADFYTTLGLIINAALSVLGVVLLVIVIYAGFLWMTAGGNKEQVQKAQKWILNAVIGLVILVSSFAISDFVIELLAKRGIVK